MPVQYNKISQTILQKYTVYGTKTKLPPNTQRSRVGSPEARIGRPTIMSNSDIGGTPLADYKSLLNGKMIFHLCIFFLEATSSPRVTWSIVPVSPSLSSACGQVEVRSAVVWYALNVLQSLGIIYFTLQQSNISYIEYLLGIISVLSLLM